MARFWAFLIAMLLATGPAAAEGKGPVILADPVFREALEATADRWAETGKARPQINYADNRNLARDIVNGAKGDLFLSFDRRTVESLEEQNMIKAGTVRHYRWNSIVLFGGNGYHATRFSVQLANPAAVQRQVAYGGLKGRIAMPDPDKVTAGGYIRDVLAYLGLWEDLADRMIFTGSEKEAFDRVNGEGAEWGLSLGSSFAILEGETPGNRVQQISTAKTDGNIVIEHLVAQLAASAHPQAAAFQQFLLSRQGENIFSGTFKGE